jgi:hypothetical protein
MRMDSLMLLTSKENLFDAKKARVSELLGVGVAISHATIDKARGEERRS